MRQKKFNIYFVQDTHFNVKDEQFIKAEWGYKAYFASNTSYSTGVAILINNNFDFEIKRVIKDKGGNFIMIHIETINNRLLLVNVYGPNQDDPEFYIKLEQTVVDTEVENVIFSGDWNLVIDFDLDYDNYKHKNNEKAHNQILEMIESLSLNDIWRQRNPKQRRYTWRRAIPFQQSRLDCFLISEVLSTFVTDADIIYGHKTDHSIVTLTLQLFPTPPRNTFWTFNASLLKDSKYVDEINKVIENIIEEYAIPSHVREETATQYDKIKFTISDQLFLDVLLMKIRQKTISYAVFNKRKKKEKEPQIENRINTLESQTLLPVEETIELKDSTEELTKIREEKMEGVLIRSRARWVAEGEKITSYFCRLEQRNYVSKCMNKIVRDDGTEINKQDEIVKEVALFYKQLYEYKENENCEIKDLSKNIKALNKEESCQLEGEITIEEAGYALKNMTIIKVLEMTGSQLNFFHFIRLN